MLSGHCCGYVARRAKSLQNGLMTKMATSGFPDGALFGSPDLTSQLAVAVVSSGNRQFSTKSDKVVEKMEKRTLRVLGLPVGRMSRFDWYEAKQSLVFWTTAGESFGWKLLDRLVKEERQTASFKFMQDPAVFLERIVNTWSLSRVSSLLPDDIMTKIVDYSQTFQPSKATYIALIRGMILRMPEKTAPLRVESILLDLWKHWEDGTLRGSPPDIVLLTIVIEAWGDSGHPDAPYRVEELLRKALDLEERTGRDELCPDTATYNAAIDCWAKSGRDIAPARAEAILDEMRVQDRFGSLRLKPNHQSFVGVIFTWANSRNRRQAGRKALALLNEMKDSGDPDMAPTEGAYELVLKTLVRSNIKGKTKIARQLRIEMESLTKDK